MESTTPTPPVSKTAWWAGAILSALPVPMLLMGVVMFFVNPDMIKNGMKEHGFPDGVAGPLIVVELICTILYVIPQTAVLGAILLTGYLEGAVATHVHAAEWSQVPFPILFGVILWLGLYLRDPHVRAVALWRR